MQDFLKQLEQLHNWKHLLREACKKNEICTSTAEQMTPKKLKTLSEWFTKVHKTKLRTDSWIEHERGAFIWVLIAFSAMKNVLISEYGEQEWRTLYKIFSNKSQNFLRYETRRFLLQKKPDKRRWVQEQEQLLSELVKEHSDLKEGQRDKWYQMARKLYYKSQQRFFRSAKECRERWSNYLDPNKVRGNWTPEQDLSLLQKVETQGKKWSEFAHQMKRNEHSVKNRYNSIISQQRKITPTIRKQQKLLIEAKKKLQNKSPSQIIPQIIPQIIIEPAHEAVKEVTTIQQSKLKIKFKNSNQSFFDDNRSSFNFHTEFQNKSRLDSNYCVQGEQYVKHLLKQDSENPKNQAYNQNFLWNRSPQLWAPFGLTPSPINFGGTNGQMGNFRSFMQSWETNSKLE